MEGKFVSNESTRIHIVARDYQFKASTEAINVEHVRAYIVTSSTRIRVCKT